MRRVEGEPHEPRAPVRRRAADDLCGLVGEQIGRIALVRGRRVIAMPIDLPLALVREIVDRAVVMAVKAGEAEVHREIGKHTSELQSLMRISNAVFCLTKKKQEKQ